MTDLAIIWTNGRGDIAQDGIDMLTDDSLTTDVTISLFTDRRALDSDTLPDGSDDRRGWWGDSYRDRPIGSRLWLLSREKATQDTLERARGYAEEALEWLKTAGRVSAVNVRAEPLHQGWLGLYVALTLPDGSIVPYEFKAAFNGV
ncbi:phage GP46 family protein [Yersinia enterocolitica]|uniref:phage GP46 family protein n=1 Tax=Yersinia enterocolitica TaxID=630 RepID=UPI001C608A4D|nr:phage GP46 family protein [Yersinia enterocolitica]MBW5820352.1 phage GP46 family protein [Yersinia enterocolitica]MBW5850331.1 phage GP46 family protein [Yersinia enterocolitica]MBW5868027.1 phage GP46 family protein [Yersinia enterocolitica]MBW5876802.1 phage GP46 family protein [Yersinia enterocolitica]